MGKRSNSISVDDLEIEVISLGEIDINEFMLREYMLAVEEDYTLNRK